MNKAEAVDIARHELRTVASAGYSVAVEHIDTLSHKSVTAQSGTAYDVELSYLWEDEDYESILVVCRVTSKHWFAHEHLEESATLRSASV